MLPSAEEVQAWVEDAVTLPTVDSPGRLRRLAADYARGRAEEHRALVVALVGATGAGKSTLLNALSGAELSREGEHRPTSRQATVYAPEDALVASLSALGPRVVRYAHHPEALWGGQVFVDTPDLNSIERENRDVALGVLEQADVAVVVLHRGSVAEAVQAELLAPFAHRRQLLFVLNFADELGAEARASLKAQVVSLAEERWGIAAEDVRVFAVSARMAKTGGDPSGELTAFLGALRALGQRATRERILRSNAVGALRELSSALEEALEKHRMLEAGLATALAGGVDAGIGQLEEDFGARLRTTLAHLKAEARQEAASRWWGPAAWWMRMSALGSSGLGAAALLARANPLTAAAVAAGSAAVSAVQRRTLSAAAERRVGALYEDEPTGELARTSRVMLSGARAYAESNGLTPARSGLPDEAGLSEMLRARLVASWRYTRERAVALAVERWWKWAKWILLPLINVPLLALLGHVAFSVVRAYFVGPYLPFDYYANAVALALVVSVGGALLAGLSLTGVARRAAAEGRRQLRRSLEELREELLEGPGHAVSTARRAAEGLVSRAKALA